MRIFNLAAALAVGLAGCQTTAEQAEDPIGFGRLDCQSIHDSPANEMQFEQARLVCTSRAEAAGLAGTAAMPVGYGIGGAIASGISRGITEAQIQLATAKSCMAEYGYALERKSERTIRCARMAPPAISTPQTKPQARPKTPASAPVKSPVDLSHAPE